MKIETGTMPSSRRSASDEEIRDIRYIANMLNVSSEDNNWIHAEIETDNYARFRSAFGRYVDKLPIKKEFTFNHIEGKRYKIWRTS